MPSSQNTTVLTIWSSTFKTQILQGKKKQEKKVIEKLSYLFFCVFPPVLHHKIDFPHDMASQKWEWSADSCEIGDIYFK